MDVDVKTEADVKLEPNIIEDSVNKEYFSIYRNDLKARNRRFRNSFQTFEAYINACVSKILFQFAYYYKFYSLK